MAESGEDQLLAYARELEEADRALAAAAAEVEELRRETCMVRERAEAAGALLERLPARREQAERAIEAAERELGSRRAEVEEAEAALAEAERADRPEQAAAARRSAVRTRDAAAMAQARLERAQAALAELERSTAEAREETPRVAARARELSARLARVPRVSPRADGPPAPDLEATAEWAARAEAALWVARGGLEAERERVVREANELGASVLGEPLAATSVALVRERLERR